MHEQIFVFRIGPLEAGGQETNWYVTSPSTEHVILNDDDGAALSEIAALFPDRPLACEPALAPAGQPRGYAVREPTAIEARARAKLWIGVEFAAWYSEIDDPVAQAALLDYSARLLGSRPPADAVLELEVAVRGTARGVELDEVVQVAWAPDRGIFVFDSLDLLRDFQTCSTGGETERADAVPRRQLHWQPGSERQREAMRAAYGTDLTPLASRDGPAGREAIDSRDAWLVAAILRVLVDWADARSETSRTAIALDEVCLDGSAAFLRGLADGPDGGIIELAWTDLAGEGP